MWKMINDSLPAEEVDAEEDTGVEVVIREDIGEVVGEDTGEDIKEDIGEVGRVFTATIDPFTVNFS